MQDVGRAPFRERRPLLDAEAVLLVDDGDGEIREVHLALDERVRADRDPDVAGGDELVHRSSLARGDARGEEGDAHPELDAQRLERQEVLLGERLGRGHQSALPTRLHRAQERVQRNRRLAGADVALEQSLHGRRPAEVGVDLGDHLLLRLGEREGQHLAVARRQGARGRKRLGDERLALDRASPERELERDELVEREPAARLLRVVLSAGPVDPDESIRAEREALAEPHARGERLATGAREGKRRLRHRAEGLLGEIGRGRVDGREVGGLDRLADVVGRDLEAEAILLAAEPKSRSGRQPGLEPRLVEPRGPDLPRRVDDVRREDVEAAAATGGRPPDTDVEDGLLVAEEGGDRPLLRRQLVAARAVGQDVADGLDPEPTELALDRRPDAGQRVDRPLEYIPPRRGARHRPARRRRITREPDRRRSPGHPAECTRATGSPTPTGSRRGRRVPERVPGEDVGVPQSDAAVRDATGEDLGLAAAHRDQREQDDDENDEAGHAAGLVDPTPRLSP